MQLLERKIGAVLIFDVRGNITDHEDDDVLKQHVMSAVSVGVRKILLNLQGVHYINSVGLGALVRVFAVIHRSGGLLWLCHPTKRISDLFAITKLRNCITVFATEREALEALDKLGIELTCPRCGPDIWLRLLEPAEEQVCRACDARFKVRIVFPVTLEHRPEVDVVALGLPTYKDERIEIVPGKPSTITIDSRLDLFTSESIAEGARLLSAPCHIVYRLTSSDISAQGLSALVELCAEGTDTSRGAISIGALPTEGRQQWLSNQTSPIYPNDEEAAAALAPFSQASTIKVVARLAE